MRLRADWLSRVLTVPYVPVLGPVHPDQFTPEIFADVFAEVLTASRAGAALPFDKDRRWSPHKTDTILVDEITHRPDRTIIPALARRGGGTMKTFYYGHSPDLDALRAATRRCCNAYRAAHGRVVWFNTDSTSAEDCTRVLLKEFGCPPSAAITGPDVTELDECAPDITATFPAFTKSMAEHGFDFLRKRRDTGQIDGPILITQARGRVVGAIGPLTITRDRCNRRMLLPQYFGVLPEQRGNGHGRALWRVVERWSIRHQVDYQLLQTRAGSIRATVFVRGTPSARLRGDRERMTTGSGSSAAQAMNPAVPRTGWDGLPTAVRAAVEKHVGKVHRVETISTGLNAAFVARLHTDTGLVFAKGVHSVRAAAQRREAFINPHVRPIAPRLHWHIDTAGWHVLGFEHLDGHRADLSPRSADLSAVTRALARLVDLKPPPIGCRRIEDRWADAAEQAGADPTLLAGDHLLHTDLNPHNILITAHGARLVDWTWPTLGAPWIDTACVALWLIAEGHTPTDAETWAAANPTWTSATSPALDTFAAVNATLWAQIAAADPRPWKQRVHAAAASWAQHRVD